MAGKQLNVEFESLESKPGTLDVAIRVNVEEGSFEFVIEENGLPTTVPYIHLAGALQLVLNQAAYRYYKGYDE
ncbi:hypothetical protein [Cytobacillus horneckiae]|uniref:hypothetical protein n=1 Tax=Cytobacillus horneckiae TaxID=549687 RepID=UPI003D9A3765